MAGPARAGGVISYRVSLVVAIPLLVLVTGVILATNTYFTTRASISRLAESLFSQVADQTAGEVEAHLSEAAPTADFLAAVLADEPTMPDSDALAHRLLDVLIANPGFAWVTLSQPDGTYTGVTRRAGKVIIHRVHRVADKTVLDEQEVQPDGSWTPSRHDGDFKYDPRERPFYKRALAEKKRSWLGPYIFFDLGVPGITCTEPVVGRDGVLRGVVTIDFDLNILSTFVATLHPSEHARVFVYTSDGDLLAHPTVRVVGQPSSGGEGKLLTQADVPDDATRVYFSEIGQAGGVANGQVPPVFESGGVRYYGATRSLPASEGLAWKVGAIAPEKDFLADLDRTTRFSLLASAVAVLLSIVLGGALARRIAAPLARLAGEMERIGHFQLDDPAPPPSIFSEIVTMNRGLEAMKGGLRSFASYVPRDLVRAVISSGQEAVLGGHTRPMTIFFSDLAGFTSFSEKMSPGDLVALLGDYFDAMTRVIGERHGTIDKFIGDAIMAFWNAPASEERHAELACQAALACLRRLEEMKRGNPAFGVLSARIGIATGEALVGNIGSRERMNYTVMGDTANLASRLEGLGKQYGTAILVSEATQRAARSSVVMRAVDVVAVKGKSQAVRIYEPLALREGASAEVLERERASEEGLDAYLARRFDEAVRAWERALTLAPGDVAATLMRDRANAYANMPPPPEWDGVAVIKEK